MSTGKVKWFSDQKGFGFITPDEGGKDLFCHHSEIQADGFRSLAEGDAVEYEPIQDAKGPKATKVRCLNKERGFFALSRAPEITVRGFLCAPSCLHFEMVGTCPKV